MTPSPPLASVILAAALFGASVAAQTTAVPGPSPQPAAKRFKNLKVLPADIPSAQLIDTMKSFTRALGVRCTQCHVGEEEKPLSTYDFASDAKPDKLIARDMMRMVHRLNTKELPAIGGLTEPKVTCFTCHRGSKEPATVPPPK